MNSGRQSQVVGSGHYLWAVDGGCWRLVIDGGGGGRRRWVADGCPVRQTVVVIGAVISSGCKFYIINKILQNSI